MLSDIRMDKNEFIVLHSQIADIGDIDTPEKIYKLFFPTWIFNQLLHQDFLTQRGQSKGEN